MSEYKISFENEGQMPVEAGFSIGRLILGLFLAVAAVALSALGWGVLAYLTDAVYFMAAIVVGAAVSYALTYPFKRVSFLGAVVLFVPAILLTVTAVLLGDYLYYVLNVMAEGYALTESIYFVAEYFLELALEDSIASVVLAAVGTVVGFANAVRG